MKIQFEDKSLIEIKKIENNDVLIVITARDHDNALKKITNTVQITNEEFKELISDIV